MNELIKEIILSWSTNKNCLFTTEQILEWIDEFNKKLVVNITEITLNQDSFWFYDSKVGEITNKNNSFFKITGLQLSNEQQIIDEHTIIIQNEIGYLGIIRNKIDGILYFLMQAQIEPGNINKIQNSIASIKIIGGVS